VGAPDLDTLWKVVRCVGFGVGFGTFVYVTLRNAKKEGPLPYGLFAGLFTGVGLALLEFDVIG
jgi:hypothetical protein